MRRTTILKSIAYITITMSTLFIFDYLLPSTDHDTIVVEISRPKYFSYSKYGGVRNEKSKDEVIFVTGDGAIKILTKNFNSTLIGDEVVLSKTMVLGMGKHLFLKKKNIEIGTSNIIYRWFLFLPAILFISSLCTILLKKKNNIENVGFGNLVLFLFALYFISKEVLI